MAGNGGLHTVAGNGGLHAVAGNGGLHTVAGNGGLHTVAGNGGLHAGTGNGDLHAVAGNGGLHAVSGNGGLHAVSGNGGLHTVSGNGGLHAGTGNGGLHAGTMLHVASRLILHVGTVHLPGVVIITPLVGLSCMRSRLSKTGCAMRGCFRLAAQSEAGYTSENDELRDILFHICCLVSVCYKWVALHAPYTNEAYERNLFVYKFHHFFLNLFFWIS